MSKSMPGRGRFPATEGATAAVPKRSVEQFRLHLPERRGADATVIDLATIRAGMTTMLDDAIEKCRIGMTAASEVLRVTSAR